MTVGRLYSIAGGSYPSYRVFVEVDGNRIPIVSAEEDGENGELVFKLSNGNTVNDVKPGERFIYKRGDEFRVYMKTTVKKVNRNVIEAECVHTQTGEFVWLDVDEEIVEKV